MPFMGWYPGRDLPWIRSGVHKAMHGQRSLKGFDFMELPWKWWGSSERPHERATENGMGLPACKKEDCSKKRPFLWPIQKLLFLVICNFSSDVLFNLAQIPWQTFYSLPLIHTVSRNWYSPSLPQLLGP